MLINPGDIVTLQGNQGSSNTYHVKDLDAQLGLAWLTHPFAGAALIKVSLEELNQVPPSFKDSTERCLEFANENRNFLDFNSQEDLSSLGVTFFLNRRFTPRQKRTLSQLCGIIASVKLNNDLKSAINLVNQNKPILDEFNLMWVNNFRDLFSGKKQMITKAERASIFNIAGFVMGEIKTQTALR